MIALDRRGLTIPRGWKRRAKAATQRIAAIVKKRAPSSGDFEKDVYGDGEFKKRLWLVQHRKCCYCEKDVAEHETQPVEHFRPKTNVAQDVGPKLVGYWWLAYEPSNLLFCCSNCNVKKGDRFPIRVGTRRLVPKQRPGSGSEHALVIDPSNVDPSKHLGFVEHRKQWHIAAKPGSEEGAKTIEEIKLDRDALHEHRNKYLKEQLAPVVHAFLGGNAAGKTAALALAKRLSGPRAPYSLLARSYFAAKGLL